MSTTRKKPTASKTASGSRSKKPKSAPGRSSVQIPAKETAAKRDARVSTDTAIAPQPADPSASQSAKPAVVNPPEPVLVGPALRKKELIEKVVLRSGMKRRDVKPIVDSMLAVLAEALADGRELVAPPLGKLRVHKRKTTPKKRILFAKLHQNLSSGASTGPDTDSVAD